MRSYYSRLIDRAEPDLVGKMKQFATYFSHGVRNGTRLRHEIHLSRTAAEILDRLDRFFESELSACPA
jgi:tRNA-dihydrouridine synthase